MVGSYGTAPVSAAWHRGSQRLAPWRPGPSLAPGWLLPNDAAGHGSGRLGVVTVGVVADGGHRLLLTEPGPGRERLTEPVVSQRLPDLGCQLGLNPPQHRPRAKPGPAAQALGRPGQQCRSFGVAFGER